MPRLPLGLAAVVSLLGCSAIINPDSDRFGGGPDVDAGPGVALMDAGDVDAAGFDAGPMTGDDAGPPGDVDAGCAARCEGGTVFTCDGEVTCPLGCSPGGEARCATMVPSNVTADLWQSDAPDVDVSNPGQTLFDTDECRATTARSMVVTQAGGGEVCVLIVRSLRVRTGSVLRAIGERPLVVMAAEEVRIDVNGAIDASTYFTGEGEAALGAGGALGGRPMRRAEGAAPGAEGTQVGSFEDGGGGGGGYCGTGGQGGSGGGGATGGVGGVGTPGELLTPLGGGSGGGYGPGGLSATDPSGRGNVGLGGGGGGAVQISTPGIIRLEGFVAAAGGGGLGGRGGNMVAGNWGAGGGGGSGGAILLEAPEIQLGTDWAMTTSGGGGGGSASSSGGGEAGENGINHLGRAAGGQRGGFRYGADGGDSGGGDIDNGEGGDSNTGSSGNGGGGGGSVGCVAVRTLSGALPAGAEARISGRTPTALRVAPVVLQ